MDGDSLLLKSLEWGQFAPEITITFHWDLFRLQSRNIRHHNSLENVQDNNIWLFKISLAIILSLSHFIKRTADILSTYGELVSSENRSKKASFLELRSHRSWHSFRLLPNCLVPQDTKLRIPSVQGSEASTRSPRWQRDIYRYFKLSFRFSWFSNMYSFNLTFQWHLFKSVAPIHQPKTASSGNRLSIVLGRKSQ